MRVAAFLGGTIIGAIAAVVLFYFLNNLMVVNGAGLLVRQGFPWSDVWLWSVAGGCIGGLATLVKLRREGIHALEIAAAARTMRLEYRPQIARPDLGDAAQMPLFAKWNKGTHHLAGQVDNVLVQMLDYTYEERGDESTSYYSQTVVLLPGTVRLPSFELRPRDFAMRMLGMMGLPGIAFEHYDAEAATVIESFTSRYHLSRGVDKELLNLGQSLQNLEPTEATDRAEDDVRSLFSLEVLHYFANHAGWHVQSSGQFLAFWQRKTIVPGADRERFLADALEARNVLTAIGARTRTAMIPAPAPPPDPLLAPARFAGTMIGLVAGFFGGFVLFVATIFGPAAQFGWWMPVGFFGSTIGGLVLGALVGNRLLTWPALAWLRRRRERMQQAVADSSWGQPPGSDARVEDDGNRLTITIPPRGLFRGAGCFLFGWSALWNLFVILFTVFFVPAAFRGEVRIEGKDQAASPWMIILFLVPFWLIGTGALFGVLYVGRRRAVLAVADDLLTITIITLIRTQNYEWHRNDVRRVEHELNQPDARKATLSIEPRQGQTVRLLGWLQPRELQWLAGLIKRRWDQ